jgi:hypothetical protein
LDPRVAQTGNVLFEAQKLVEARRLLRNDEVAAGFPTHPPPGDMFLPSIWCFTVNSWRCRIEEVFRKSATSENSVLDRDGSVT